MKIGPVVRLELDVAKKILAFFDLAAFITAYEGDPRAHEVNILRQRINEAEMRNPLWCLLMGEWHAFIEGGTETTCGAFRVAADRAPRRGDGISRDVVSDDSHPACTRCLSRTRES